jgi:hypothetical protein
MATRSPWCRVLLPCLLLSILGAAVAAAEDRAPLPSRHLLAVPFFPQTERACGPSALAGVLAYWEQPRPVEEIAARVFHERLGGTLTLDLVLYARSLGFHAEEGAWDLERIRASVARGRPVIVLVDLGGWLIRQPHYGTVVGYDDGRRVLIAHWGEEAEKAIPYDTFEEWWKRMGRWGLVVEPKE